MDDTAEATVNTGDTGLIYPARREAENAFTLYQEEEPEGKAAPRIIRRSLQILIRQNVAGGGASSETR